MSECRTQSFWTLYLVTGVPKLYSWLRTHRGLRQSRIPVAESCPGRLFLVSVIGALWPEREAPVQPRRCCASELPSAPCPAAGLCYVGGISCALCRYPDSARLQQRKDLWRLRWMNDPSKGQHAVVNTFFRLFWVGALLWGLLASSYDRWVITISNAPERLKTLILGKAHFHQGSRGY